MKSIKAVCVYLMMVIGFTAAAQKTITEGTLIYDIKIQTGNNEDGLKGATSTLYLKGPLSRTDMMSVLGTESTIYDAKNGSGVILKEYSGQKLMITLSKDNWIEKNKKFDNIFFTETGEKKTIAGYECKKAVATLKDGTAFVVYYSPDLLPANKEHNISFQNLAGLAMQYEYSSDKTKYIYTLSRISFDAVPASKFDSPKSGYRVMTYDENKQIKKGE